MNNRMQYRRYEARIGLVVDGKGALPQANMSEYMLCKSMREDINLLLKHVSTIL